jgi:hypothetical protein
LFTVLTEPAATSSTGTVTPKDERMLRATDLPDGYAFTSFRTETGRAARYPVVDDECDLDPSVASTGTAPATASAAFRGPSGHGSQFLYTFSSTKGADAYFTSFDRGFDDLAECGTVISSNGAIGSYGALDLGKAGDERSGLTFEPSGDDPTGRFALVRNGRVVNYVELQDRAATDAEFRALVKAADRRIG